MNDRTGGRIVMLLSEPSCIPYSKVYFFVSIGGKMINPRPRNSNNSNNERWLNILPKGCNLILPVGQSLYTSMTTSSSSCPAILYITSFQWLAQASAATLGSARSSPVHCGPEVHLMMWSMVCGTPHTLASEHASFHFFMDALQRPSPTRRRFRVFQTAQG